VRIADASLNHLDEEPLYLPLRLGQGEETGHPREQEAVANGPGIVTDPYELELPGHRLGKARVHAVAIGLAGSVGLRAEFVRFLREPTAPVHAPKEPVDLDHLVAAFEQLCCPPLAEDPHDQHLHAAIHGVAVPHAPVEAGDVVC
jgi:hypothetical protein